MSRTWPLLTAALVPLWLSACSPPSGAVSPSAQSAASPSLTHGAAVPTETDLAPTPQSEVIAPERAEASGGDDIIEDRQSAIVSARRETYERRAFDCARGQTGLALMEGLRSKQAVIARVVRACVMPGSYIDSIGVSEGEDRAYITLKAREALETTLADDNSAFKSRDH